MKKWFLRIFIWLFIFAVSGYSNLYAHTDTIASATIKNLVKEHSFNFNEANNDFEPIYKATISAAEKHLDKIDPTDNEEEEEQSSGKITACNKFVSVQNYFTSAFYPQVPGYFCSSTKKRISRFGQFFCFPSQSLHLIFRVIRI